MSSSPICLLVSVLSLVSTFPVFLMPALVFVLYLIFKCTLHFVKISPSEINRLQITLNWILFSYRGIFPELWRAVSALFTSAVNVRWRVFASALKEAVNLCETSLIQIESVKLTSVRRQRHWWELLRNFAMLNFPVGKCCCFCCC